MKWIYVRDSLPDEHINVLAIDQNNHFHIGFFKDLFFYSQRRKALDSQEIYSWIYFKDIPRK